MSPPVLQCSLWMLFIATHVALLAAPIQSRLEGALGRPRFMALFIAIALATFVPLLWHYDQHKHTGPLLWSVVAGGSLRFVLYAGNALAMVLMAGALLTPGPLSPRRQPDDGRDWTPRGVQWLTRHGLFMGLAVWALMHCVVNGSATDVAFFGGFVVCAGLGCWHQDRRKVASGDPVYRAYVERTPFFPFTGRQTLRGLREFSRPGLLLGLGAAVLLRVFHVRLFA